MIITDEALLRVKCIDALPEEIGSIIDQLERELENSAQCGRPGVGLSAPQIGINKNVAIIRIGKEYKFNLVNCKIVAGWDQAFFEDEGCLSFPDKYVRTKRYQEIYVVDNVVEPLNFIVTGICSVVVQHELNHCEGILLSDLSSELRG